MATPYAKTVDGIESQFGTNHIGHFLLTNLLMGKILAAAPGARIVNVSSSAHQPGVIRFEDWNFSDGKAYNPWEGYAQSKMANILFTESLAEKLGPKGVFSYSLHPGCMLLWPPSPQTTSDSGGICSHNVQHPSPRHP
jgi:NAD(P)-dependent dehydrogenase (short-subunit alcohol dehydrogenase family)